MSEIENKPKNLNAGADNLFEAAKLFDAAESLRIRKNAKIAWRLVGVMSGITALSVLAVCLLTPLKSVEPIVIRVDNNTGLTDMVSLMKERQDSYDEIIDKFNLKRYVEYREGYDWVTIQDTFNATKLMSNGNVAAEFEKFYATDNAPHKVLKNGYKVVVRVQSVAFVGGLAQVRFIKQRVPVGSGIDGQKSAPLKMIATIAWEYQGGKMSEQDRLINPLGFKVKSYRVDREQ